jgi:hypothetical protein
MKSLFFICSILLFGCSLDGTNVNNSNLKDSFNEYKSLYGTPSESALLKAELWESLVKAREIKEQSAFVNSLAKFPNEIVKTIDTKESIQGEFGCLLVSGSDTNGVELDYYITFNLTNNKWIISEVTIKYFLDGSERYLEKAVCDEQERMTLWLQSV